VLASWLEGEEHEDGDGESGDWDGHEGMAERSRQMNARIDYVSLHWHPMSRWPLCCAHRGLVHHHCYNRNPFSNKGQLPFNNATLPRFSTSPQYDE